MFETANLGLPLLQPSQAQKHVTVNEALVRIDALAQLRLESRTVASPPAEPTEGVCYALPHDASGDWSGHVGELAIAANGGWTFVRPEIGWRGWAVDEHAQVVFADGTWHHDLLALSPSGAGSRFTVDEAEVTITEPGTQEIPLEVPQEAMVFACSARVTEAITGTVTSWSLGFADEPGKFGSGMGLAEGSYCSGVLSHPTTYYSPKRPTIAPIGGEFAGGRLTVALHSYRIILPV